MLERIKIQDFAIIDRLELDFTAGLNIFTGETGAGKSVLVGALNLLLGGRPKSDPVRDGANRAVVEAEFLFPAGEETWIRQVRNLANESGLAEILEDEVLVLRREVHLNGRGRCFVNGATVPLRVLRQFARALIHIHGQNENQEFLDPASHGLALDDWCARRFGPAFTKIRDNLKAAFQRWRVLRREWEQWQTRRRDSGILREFRAEKLRQIDELGLSPGEYPQLKEELALLKTLEILAGKWETIWRYFHDDDARGHLEQAGTVLDHLGGTNQGVWPEIRDHVAEGIIRLEEARHLLEKTYQETGEEFDPERLEWVQARLNKMEQLSQKISQFEDRPGGRGKKKGGEKDNPDTYLLELAEHWRREMEDEDGSQMEARFTREFGKISAELSELAGELSHWRLKGARELESALDRELADLGMENSQFQITLSWRARKPAAGEATESGPGRWVFHKKGEKQYIIEENGLDQVRFLLGTRGGKARPLEKIASGGELSRIMLAYKTARFTADEQNMAFLVFDEVDTGVGGAVAEAVGEKLRLIAEKNQVMVITHLHQIASQLRTRGNRARDRHFLVEKKTVRDRKGVSSFLTQIRKLKHADRTREMARMLGGRDISRTVLEHAAELTAGPARG